jgi:hypothetical protein
MIGMALLTSEATPAVTRALPRWKPSCNAMDPSAYPTISATIALSQIPPPASSFVDTSPTADKGERGQSQGGEVDEPTTDLGGESNQPRPRAEEDVNSAEGRSQRNGAKRSDGTLLADVCPADDRR